MSDLLSEEERSALQAPYAASVGRPREVARAEFPSVSQLDPERGAALVAALKLWLTTVSQELARQLRVPCIARPPYLQTVTRTQLPLTEEEAIWAVVEDYPECQIVLTMPRSFSASLCERIFGAPLAPRENRTLSPAERSLLDEIAGSWMTELSEAWEESRVHPCPPPDADETPADSPDENWLRWTSDLHCGPVEGAISLSMAPSTALVLMGVVSRGGSVPLTPTCMVGRLGEVPVELRAVLGQAELTLDELSSLQVGDVIALDRRARDPVELLIGENAFCRARAGLAGQLVAVELIADASEETKHER
jgi:flagellar motor switch protein FliM